MMLTSDISLTRDPKYLALVQLFSNDQTLLGYEFSHAWYKLMTRDMGPVERCFGSLTAPPQPFQYPLPAPSKDQPYWRSVKESIKQVMHTKSDILVPDTVSGNITYGSYFVKLSYQCASSFRRTDNTGGCNGARIRFAPQKDWSENIGTDQVLSLLKPVKDQFGDILSWADLIVLAGTTALEEASGLTYDFCGGRSDATDGLGWESLKGLTYQDKFLEFKDKAELMGMTAREMVALFGKIRGSESQKKLGYKGSWMTDKWDNQYFKLLINEKWTHINDKEVKADGKELYMTAGDVTLLYNATLLSIVQEYAQDNATFQNEFKAAWTKLMNADRFDGPVNNKCDKKSE